jgi:hypothetical protein
VSTGCRVSHCHSSPKVCIVAYYFMRRYANYKITTYCNTYRPSLQLSYVAQTYPVNGFSFSGNQTATAIVNENIFWLYRVFRRMYEFPSKILFNSVSPGTILWFYFWEQDVSVPLSCHVPLKLQRLSICPTIPVHHKRKIQGLRVCCWFPSSQCALCFRGLLRRGRVVHF